ncbi:MAG: tetratricopeptide repeat protein [Blastocatellia bacterium]|nr:tetratricopeptide repeat protein [Blastocatellia bacterium]
MKETVLHITLGPVCDGFVELTYWIGNPKHPTSLLLEISSIKGLIEQFEADEYLPFAAELTQVGQTLYNWLNHTDRFLELEIGTTPANYLLVLAFEINPALARLPWEALHDGNHFLAENQEPRIVPVRWKTVEIPSLPPANRDLHVVFMAAAPRTSSSSGFEFEREEAALFENTANQRVTVALEGTGNVAELGRFLSVYEAGTPDVVHLSSQVMHTAEGPRLLTESPTGSLVCTSAEELSASLNGQPRLVFLSGYRTDSNAKTGALASFAAHICSAQLPLVLEWERPAQDTRPRYAMRTLYQSLLVGNTPTQAVADIFQTLLTQEVRDWYLVRFYIAGRLPAPFVTPLSTPGRQTSPLPVMTTRQLVLKSGRLVRLNNRRFVGRRRSVQRCLKTLRFEKDTLGTVIYGPPGVGKSSLLARLCERLESEFLIVPVTGSVSERSLVQTISETLGNPAVTALLHNQRHELRMNLWRVFESIEKPVLLVFDNFEENFEKSGAEWRQRYGLPVLSYDSRRVWAALSFAIQQTKGRHRVLVASREQFAMHETGVLRFEELQGLTGPDLSKKLRLLEAQIPIETKFQTFARQAAVLSEGNPRLLERLYNALPQPEVNWETLLARLANSSVEQREDLLNQELLWQQPIELRRLLARLTVYRVPVPKVAAEAVSSDIPHWLGLLTRATKLGLVETSGVADETVFWVLPAIRNLVLPDRPLNVPALKRTAARALFRVWNATHSVSEKEALELHRLATAGNVAHIAREMAFVVSNFRLRQGRLAEAIDICQQTITQAGNDSRLLHNLARAEEMQSNPELALRFYRESLEACPAADLHSRATIQHNLALLLAHAGKQDEALELSLSTLELADKIGDARNKVESLQALAMLYLERNDLATACSHYQKALSYLVRIEDQPGQAALLHQLSLINEKQGNLSESLLFAQQALEVFETLEDPAGLRTALNQIGNIYGKQGKVEAALDHYRKSLHLEAKSPDNKGKAAPLVNVAQLLAKQGDFQTALSYLHEATSILTLLKSPDLDMAREIMVEVYTMAIESKLGERAVHSFLWAWQNGDKLKIKSILDRVFNPDSKLFFSKPA